MKFVAASETGFSFEFNLREKQMLFRVLALYPLIPAKHHRLSRTADDDEAQRLLDELLANHRDEARRKVKDLMSNPRHFKPSGEQFLWIASRADMEWLLQVLNEVRVGSWLTLGRPDLQKGKTIPPSPDNFRHYWAMDVAGGFEMIFIAALSGELPVQND